MHRLVGPAVALILAACGSGRDVPTSPAEPAVKPLPAPVRVLFGPVLHVCPDRQTALLLEHVSAEDSVRILAEHPCQPVAVAPGSIMADTAKGSP
ncbi:MAG: hypothetical protein ACJ8DC_20140 [Gemmatimonadales bacterium]